MQQYVRLATVAIFVLAGCSKNQEPRTLSPEIAREGYFQKVTDEYWRHKLWRRNPALGSLDVVTTGETKGESIAGSKVFILGKGNPTPEIATEAAVTLARIHQDMDVFIEPMALTAGEQEALLASPEGWIKFSAEWQKFPVDSSIKRPRLRVAYEAIFQPQKPPSTKQDMNRLLE